MINILEYQYGSDKGSARNGETFASPLGYQGMNPYYTTASVDGEEVTSLNADGHAYLEWTPLTEGSLRVVRNGQIVSGAAIENAATGEISGVQVGDMVYYMYDNETIPVTAPQIKLNIKSLPVTAQARKLSAIWSFDAQYELSKELTLKVA